MIWNIILRIFSRSRTCTNLFCHKLFLFLFLVFVITFIGVIISVFMFVFTVTKDQYVKFYKEAVKIIIL